TTMTSACSLIDCSSRALKQAAKHFGPVVDGITTEISGGLLETTVALAGVASDVITGTPPKAMQLVPE
ncbi:MAG: hypothetical protein ACREP9_14500, partial [Candidatus Dormibacteraceae bacterium]